MDDDNAIDDDSASTSPATARRRGLPRPVVVVASYAATVLFLLTLNFFLPRAMPGDPVSSLQNASASNYVQDDPTRVALDRYYGLDRPVLEQYGHYLSALARGDLGTSIRYQAPVSRVLGERLPWTLLLVGSAIVLATILGLPAGIHSGWHRGRAVDQGLLSLFLGIRNLPVFFLASLALFVFAVKLRWVPVAGASTPFSGSLAPLRRVADVAHHLALPASVLALQMAAGHYLLMRASMVAELGSDYLLLGRAKGLTERRLKYRYAARNALLPVVNLSAAQVGLAVTASVFVETVFAYPGLGRLLFEAVAFRDYPVLQACFLVLTLIVVSANLLADALSVRLDRRATP